MVRAATIAILIPAFLSACDSPTRPTGDGAPATGDQTSAVQTVYGRAVIAAFPGRGDLLVTVDGGDRPGSADGTVDLVFLLQRERTFELPLFHDVADATVQSTPDGVLVTAPGGFSAELFISSRLEGTRRSLASGVGMPGQSWVGYGLSRRTGTWVVPSRETLADFEPLLACSRVVSAAVGGPRGPLLSSTCDSGGTGSQQCSTSCAGGGSCGVTCDGRHYSCCDSAKCTCTCQKTELLPHIPG